MKKSVLLDSWWLKTAPDTSDCENAVTSQMLNMAIDRNDNGINGWLACGSGDQVQATLLKYGLVDERILDGETEQYAWIAEKDWIYVCEFSAESTTGNQKQFLHFKGLDTIADIYLNGKCIGHHQDMYLENRIDVSEVVRVSNRLFVYFYSPYKICDKRASELSTDRKNTFGAFALLRKCSIDFGDFGHVKLTPVGIFDDVTLETIGCAEITWNDINVQIGEKYLSADIYSAVECYVALLELTVKMTIRDPQGIVVSEAERCFPVIKPNDRYEVMSTVKAPCLWWPKNYGDQPIYSVQTDIVGDGQLLDSVTKSIGIRRLEMVGDMKFRINGKPIKLWGGNIVPFYGLSHRWQEERCSTIIDLIDKMNMNCLRLWGGGMQCGDSLYDECDRRGIMIWQDFYLSWGYYPDSEQYRNLCRLEALQIVKRLKHRACILLWCGGNESFMHNEEGYYDHEWKDIGYKLFRYDFSEACKRLDPDRQYILSSPSKGEYPNDPSEGDSHPLYYSLRHSVWQFPVFTSESARTSTGPLRSLEKFLSPEEIWPEGYVDQITYKGAYSPFEDIYRKAEKKNYLTTWKRTPIPRAFWRRAASFFASETGPVEKFYDAHDSQSLIYRVNAAYAYFTKKYTEMARRGKPFYEIQDARKVTGNLLWKINDTWPQLYCTLIDYYLEVYIPYYQVKRSFSPVILSFDFQDHILLWGVNDSSNDISGKLLVKVFSQARNIVENEMVMPVFVEAGQSKVLTDLDRLCPIMREAVVYVALTNDMGDTVCTNTTLMDLERHLIFPEAKLELRQDDNEIVIKTDKFAHCIELIGNDHGDEFGWYFEDNYFDLLPFEEKHVKIFGKHINGIVSAKAQYSPHKTEIDIYLGTSE